MINVAILGFGVVGSGTYEVLEQNAARISAYCGEAVQVKYIVDIRDFSAEPFGSKVVKDFSIVENDPSVTIVAEVIGGATIAYDFTKRALLAGKHVVTSNKELVATRGEELLAIAREKGVNYLFEASVGGGIPLIRPMLQCLAANEITQITGIVNGTTNYILTRMIEDNVSFAECLKEAQEKGYAEKDPTADVEGHDALRKICILTSLVTGYEVRPDEVTSQGITQITLEDVAYAEKMHKVIKLLARSVIDENGKAFIYVAPHMIDKNHPLASVSAVFNAVMVTGNMVDEVMFYGKGAGKLATASAVVADIMDCVLHKDKRRNIGWVKPDQSIVKPLDTMKSRYYLRVNGDDYPNGKIFRVSHGEFAAITEEITPTELAVMLADLGDDAKAVMRIF